MTVHTPNLLTPEEFASLIEVAVHAPPLADGPVVARELRFHRSIFPSSLNLIVAPQRPVPVSIHTSMNLEQWMMIVRPSHLLALFLKKAPEAKDVQALQAAIRGPEKVRAHGKQLYVVYPEGVGKSKLTNTLIERKLGTRGTGRNWNTVLKLAALTRE